MKQRIRYLLVIFFVFSIVSVGYADTINLTGTIRDFNDTHPDMENGVGSDPGIVLSTLGADGKPIYAGTTGNPTTTMGKPLLTSGIGMFLV